MILTGIIKETFFNWENQKLNIVLEVEEKPSELLNELIPLKKLFIEIKKFRNKRSLNANGLMWKCLSELSVALNTDKWDLYLQYLKVHGPSTYIVVRPNQVEKIKRQWREVETIGPIKVNGQDAVQLLCYYGSSNYDTKDFSILLDDIIEGMKDAGLEPPTEREKQKSLEKWEKQING